MNNKINISPVSIWTSSGLKTATQFSVRYINYQNGPAVADCQLLDADNNEVTSQTIDATAEQTAAWDNDAAFYAVLATNAGLTPTP